ncbi:conserved hypothetical protein [Pediculus humanus corporis]|uniref:ADP-ribose pyrophosphatase, mitochondrial n=1 Tax=Pediculus humanus subsp. corporis TaxID=121224 RepID=E0W2X6_PEDHC|nr:uncharacterized protein Phum_PHUM598920 [Pediculus humanus corporis]EEB19982.1 conserved hypothetical protein [Pediculus humanus corporis]
MSLKKVIEKLPVHVKCKNSIYPKSKNIVRFPVPDDKVLWNIEWPQYSPVVYTSSNLTNQPWADPPLETHNFNPKWNCLDGKVNRKSHFCEYAIVDGLPINPIGRTGIKGRGVLGRWGPNHAADPIITRWKRNSQGVIECDVKTQKPILQFVAIERRDCHEWAIPGGMVDPEIFKGYVDDPRNTDNSWIETVATNFHDDDGSHVSEFQLSAGDDALNVKWIDINFDLTLYASHKNFISQVARIRNSHW